MNGINQRPVAIVTGARRGIGLAIACALGREGYHVVCAAQSDAKAGESCIRQLQEQGSPAEYLRCDIAQPGDRQALLDTVLARHGRLDLLVNNAGVAPLVRADLLETSEESLERLLRINLEGTFFLCQGAARRMIELQQHGIANYQPRLINISSISSYTSSVNRGEYCISKAGISMITRLFADRLAEYGIPVFEVSPGIIQTDMTAAVQDKYQTMIDAGLTPIRRFGQPEDVANCVLAAASGRLDFATGQVLHADGGFHLRRL